MPKAYIPTDTHTGLWRSIPGYGGKYQASRLGDVRRVFPSGLVRDMTPYMKKGAKHQKILRNRLFVKLTINGKSKEVAVLKIMADTWKKRPQGNFVPYHKNGIVTDNRADNIDFIDRKSLGKITGHRTRKRKTVFKVDKGGEVVEIYRSAREAAKANNMSYQTVLDRCHNKVKNPYALDGFTYQFEDGKPGRPKPEENKEEIAG